MRGSPGRANVGRMDRIMLTAVLVGGYFALVVAANVETPVERATAAAVAAAPATADAAERWYDVVGSGGSGAAQTADAAERSLTSSFETLPKPFVPR